MPNNKQTTAVNQLIEILKSKGKEYAANYMSAEAWVIAEIMVETEDLLAIERKQIEDAANNVSALAVFEFFNNMDKSKDELLKELQSPNPLTTRGSDYFTSTFITD